MNNTTALRSLVTFGILIPVAVFLGYVLADPLQYSTFATIGVVLAVMVFPLLLKWHQPMLLLSWNLAVMIPFIKGSPNLWMIMAAVTLSIALLQRALDREMRFVQVWQMTFPLLALVAVVLVTAKLTGGFGLRSFGSEVAGGKKYIFVLGSIAAYFALTAWRIPNERAKLYTSLFILGGATYALADFWSVAPTSLRFIWWFIPAWGGGQENDVGSGFFRFVGVGAAGRAIYFFLLLRYGIRGTFMSGKPWRILLVGTFFALGLLGGFRSALLEAVLIFVFLFFLEKLHRSPLLFAFLLLGLLGSALLIPAASKLPFMMQRALAFLPLDIDPMARGSAEGSSEWRIKMWQDLMPEIPKHLLLGKGYALSQEDLQMMGVDTSFRSVDASQIGLAISGDYHNGPLSVILPFGIWGVIAMVWLLGAGFKLLYRNFRYGEESVKAINRFLFALFLMRLVMFVFIVGGLSTDLWIFTGIFGLSVSLNGGMAKKPLQLAEHPVPLQHRRILQPRPSFQR
jgi:hypothetical protein